jgi:hypothetical protein
MSLPRQAALTQGRDVSSLPPVLMGIEGVLVKVADYRAAGARTDGFDMRGIDVLLLSAIILQVLLTV